MLKFRLLGQCNYFLSSCLRGLDLSSLLTVESKAVLSKSFCINQLKMNITTKQQAKYLDCIVWVDMEMTGLDVVKDQILEFACIVTDSNLNILVEGPELVIHQPDHILNGMEKWCTDVHGKSGLTERSRQSKTSIKDAEQEIVGFLNLHTFKGKCPLAGNSIYMDRLFLKHYMPLVDQHLHYRIIDVSTVKELCRRWCPDKYALVPKKEYGHRAMMDIRESIGELKYYRTAIFDKHAVPGKAGIAMF